MITTDKGSYLSEFTPEMMEKVKKMVNAYPCASQLCKEITGKNIFDHEQDYVKANWDKPYPFRKTLEFIRGRNFGSSRDVIVERFKNLMKNAMKNNYTYSKLCTDEIPDSWFNVQAIADSLDTLFLQETDVMHEKFPETIPKTFLEVMDEVYAFDKTKDVLHNFLLNTVVPIVKQNYKNEQEQKRLKRNAQAREKRLAKKQKQG